MKKETYVCDFCGWTNFDGIPCTWFLLGHASLVDPLSICSHCGHALHSMFEANHINHVFEDNESGANKGPGTITISTPGFSISNLKQPNGLMSGVLIVIQKEPRDNTA